MNSQEVSQALLRAQKNEITEHWVYHKLAESIRDPHNRSLLKKIAEDELKHYEFWKKYTNRDVKRNRFKGWFYYLISKIFGFTFGVKLMERDEDELLCLSRVDVMEFHRSDPSFYFLFVCCKRGPLQKKVFRDGRHQLWNRRFHFCHGVCSKGIFQNRGVGGKLA
ncbi:MAG: hypothetical protein A2W09_02430 [Deltaproteobacteria bacterium RBG_16_50_11]|nr:MAG: hypothetical protein A2W09_02430 [Deltaproteobacteria bacterium RBG_16_50_11]